MLHGQSPELRTPYYLYSKEEGLLSPIIFSRQGRRRREGRSQGGMRALRKWAKEREEQEKMRALLTMLITLF
jgi:hypothetical protein